MSFRPASDSLGTSFIVDLNHTVEWDDASLVLETLDGACLTTTAQFMYEHTHAQVDL